MLTQVPPGRRYLSDPSHRETFESAHSVILSIFASNAQQQQQPGHQSSCLPGRCRCASEARHEACRCSNEHFTTATESAALDSTRFVHRMVPYYAQCLIENSQDGRLSTAQLRLAYAALVRSASSNSDQEDARQLGWYCISVILDTIRELSQQEPGSPGDDPERLHRLLLTLISTVPSHPLPLMIRTLEEIQIFITTRPQSDSGVAVVGDGVEIGRRRKELVDALFAEILERVGDREKEAAMRWWYTHRRSFLPGGDDAALAMTGEKVDDAQSRPDIVSRL
ncbi:hypothetical protein DXG03_007440 [Asterophora parasitica]|uniref:Uncharacterized protein n=1 Tax=Asterophora parasitica TaxID=117018 RepID=A0A9P7G7E4_9AGAR|nr:hypothetical protein DXG03_007440 [Asterophora parasitica]